MGKKGSWISAIKRVFTSNSKEKPVNEGEKKSRKEKKGRLKHGSFIPFSREPSSIEKILGEIDQHNLYIQQSQSQSQLQPQVQPSSSGRGLSSSCSSPRVTSPKPSESPPVISITSPPRQTQAQSQSQSQSQSQTRIIQLPEADPQQQHVSATKIQSVYRGHQVRRKLRCSTGGVVRLQEVVKGQHVKRQTVNAMKRMQLLVRIQTQIQSRRLQMLENQAIKREVNKNDKQSEISLSEIGDENWDDSLITKEERELRLQKKMEAMIKRERAMAYAYSHQLWKSTPKSAQNSLMDLRSGGYPWWWNWLDRQLQQPSDTRSIRSTTPLTLTSTSTSKQTPEHKPSPRQLSSSPLSSRSMAPSRTKRLQMTPPRTTPTTTNSNNLIKYSINNKLKGSSSQSQSNSSYPMRDDDSLMSCPPAFSSVPSYMSPTVSARAKARPTTSANNTNPRDRAWVQNSRPNTPGSETSKRRFSFPLTPNSVNGGNGPFNRNNNKYKSPGSVGDMSVNSAVSMPSSVGRKPFNRFV